MNPPSFAYRRYALLAVALAALTPGQVLAQATLIAGWDFQTTNTGGTAVAAAPNTPTTFIANFGSGSLNLNGSNGSSTWLPATELSAFAGTATNASNGLSTVTTTPAALAVLGGTANSANGKAAVFVLDTSGRTNISITLAAQRTSTGFTNQFWEVSPDGSAWSAIGNLTAGTTAGTIQTSFAATGVIGFTNIPQLANLSNARVRVTFTGASAASGNIRIDNIQFVGEPLALPGAPVIVSFAPPAGTVGTSVSISGSNFTGVTGVGFSGIAATSFAVVNDTTLNATVPVGASTGKITATNANGAGTSATDFIILDGSGTATVQNGTAPYTGKNIFPRATAGQTLQVVYSPPAAGTVEGLRIEVPAAFGAPLVGNVSVSGGGGTPSASVSGQVVTVTGLAATSAGNVTVSISGLTMPDTSTPITNTGANVVNIQSRGSGGTFAAIASSPSALVTIPLANARNYDANFSPVLSNTVVAVQGTASVPKLANRGISSAIQDATWGVALDATTNVVISNLVRGNNYAAVGRISQFNGLVQISITNAADILNLGAGTDPVPVTATVSQFTNTNTAPTFQSRVTRIENLNKLSGTWATTNSVILTNTAGEQVTVFIPFNSTATTEPSYPVTVTGIGGQFDTNSPFNTGFQLQPRDPADLTSATLPSISVNPASISNLTATQGNFGPSTNFLVNASNLSNNITVTANDAFNFAISTNNTDFTNTLSLPTNSSGAVTNASVFVRLSGAAPAGVKSNTVSLDSGSVSTNVSVSGTVIDPTAPNITPNPIALSNFTTLRGTASSNQTVTITGSNLGGSNVIVTSSNNFYEISTNAIETPFSNSLTLASTGGVVAVRISTNAPATNSLLGNLALSGGGATNNVPLSGVVTNPPPSIMVSTNILPVFTGNTNQVSAIQSFTAGGSNLSNNITVTAPAGFTLSFVELPFAASNSLILSNETGTATNRVLYVRMNAFASVTNIPATNITLTTIGASNAVTISGSVTAAPPSLTATPPSLTNFSTVTGIPSAAQSYALSGSNLGAVSVTAPPGFEVALTNTNSAFGGSVSPAVASGNLNTNIWVRVSSLAVTNSNLTGSISNVSGSVFTNVALQARVLPVPTLSAVPTALSNFSTVVGIASTNQSFNLSATNLLGVANLTVTNGYEISLNPGSGFTTNLSVSGISAVDNAGNYAGGWTNGANGGAGFGPWSISVNTGSNFFAGAFIGDPNFAGITGFGTNAFGLYANPQNTAATVSVDRPFTLPLTVGETFSLQWAVNWDAGNGNKGFNVYAGGAGGTQLVNVNQGNFPGNITFNGSDAITNYGSGPMTWSFTMTSLTNLLVTSTARDGSTNVAFTTNIVVAGAPDAVRFYTTAMSQGDQRQPYFNNLRISGAGGNISNLPVYVRIGTNAPISEATNSLASRVTISSTNATDTGVDLFGRVEDRPSLTAVPAAISNLITTNGYASAPTNFAVTGRNLSNNVTITVTPTNDSNFEISTNGSSWTNFLSLAPTNRSVSNSVQVRITPLAPVSGTNELTGLVTVRTDGALSATNVLLLGTVLVDSNIPSITASTYALSGLGSVESFAGPSTNFTVSGTFLRGPITVTAENSFLAVSTDNTNFGASVSLPRGTNNDIANAPVYVRITQFAPVSTNTNVFLGNLLLDTTRNSNNLPAPTNVAVFGTVTNWSIANPYNIRVTNPFNPVQTNATNFTFRGQIGTALAGANLSWSNWLRGEGGTFAAESNYTWAATNLPLLVGTNTMVFAGQFQTNAGPTNVAFDTPQSPAYGNQFATNWVNGSGGTNTMFGNWSLAATSGGLLWRANTTVAGNINVIPAGNAFTIASGFSGTASAYRAFPEALQAPDGSFSVYFGNNDVAANGAVGMSLVGTVGTNNRVPLFTFAAVNNDDGLGTVYQITDKQQTNATPPGWMGATKAGLLLNFEMTSSNGYTFTATRLDDNVAMTNSGSIAPNIPVSGVEFFSAFAGDTATNPAYNLYIGQMLQTHMQFATATTSVFAPDVVRTSAPASAYNAWAVGYGLDPATNGAPGADPDKDGFSNDMEYAFGTNPTVANATVLTAMQSGTNMIGTFVARINGVSYAVQERANLAAPWPGWTNNPSIVPTTNSVIQTNVPTNYERRSFSVPASGNDFFRVRATINE